MNKKIKKIVLIVCTMGFLFNSCGKNTTSEGEYYYSSGEEKCIIAVDAYRNFIIMGTMLNPINGVLENVIYSGTLDDNNMLRIKDGNNKDLIGEEFGEWTGNEIISGGWSFVKSRQFKHNTKDHVAYIQNFGRKITITVTRGNYDIEYMEYNLGDDGKTLFNKNGEKCGKIKLKSNSCYLSGIKGYSGFYKEGDYTYETGPCPQGSTEKIKTKGNKSTKKTNNHKNNSDGFYDGQYTYRSGMEWGNLEIKGNVWSAQGLQEMPMSGLEEFGYSGVIRDNELVVTSTMYGTNATGMVFAEFDGNNISAGGWTYRR